MPPSGVPDNPARPLPIQPVMTSTPQANRNLISHGSPTNGFKPPRHEDDDLPYQPSRASLSPPSTGPVSRPPTVQSLRTDPLNRMVLPGTHQTEDNIVQLRYMQPRQASIPSPSNGMGPDSNGPSRRTSRFSDARDPSSITANGGQGGDRRREEMMERDDSQELQDSFGYRNGVYPEQTGSSSQSSETFISQARSFHDRRPSNGTRPQDEYRQLARSPPRRSQDEGNYTSPSFSSSRYTRPSPNGEMNSQLLNPEEHSIPRDALPEIDSLRLQRGLHRTQDEEEEGEERTRPSDEHPRRQIRINRDQLRPDSQMPLTQSDDWNQSGQFSNTGSSRPPPRESIRRQATISRGSLLTRISDSPQGDIRPKSPVLSLARRLEMPEPVQGRYLNGDDGDRSRHRKTKRRQPENE